VERHDARGHWHLGAELARGLDEVEVGIGVEEELRDRAARAGVDLVDVVL
jgi:hypothetical protein